MNVNQLIKYRLKLLANSNNSLKDIFEIIHSDESLVFCEKTNGYKIIKTTYGECKTYCFQMGYYLSRVLKEVPKHTFIGIMMENCLEFITSLFGLLMAGYKPVLLNVRLGKDLNNQIIERLGVKYVIVDSDYPVSAKKIIVKDFDYCYDEFDDRNFEWENELALSTSATSLNVKICIYDGEAICEQIKNTNLICKKNSMIKKHYDGYIKQLAFLPFYHIFGLMALYFWFAFFGRCFVFLKDYSSDTILRTVKKHHVTHLFAVPMLWHTVYKEINKEIEKQDEKTKKKFYQGIKLSNKIQSIFPKFGLMLARQLFKEVQNKIFGDSIRFMISGGSYISEDAITTLNGIGYPLFNGYGMSEIGITSVELSKKAKIRNFSSIGKPFARVEYLIDSDGHLFVKSKGICKRIIAKDKDILIDHNNYFDTGDLAYKNDDGRYYIIGRTDDVVLTENGEKINPDLIEKMLKIYSVERYSILGIHLENKEYLALVLEVDGSTNQLKINRITKEVQANLQMLEANNYHIDKVFYTYDRISAPTAIKVSRKILTKWISEKKVNLMPFNELKEQTLEDLNELQKTISNDVQGVFADILGIDSHSININSHFIFDLGGSSLDYLTLLVKLKERYEIEFNLDNEVCYSIIEFTNYIIRHLK